MAISSFLKTVFRRKTVKSTELNDIFEFDFDAIKAATNDFSDVVGRGGFGYVFKGRLESGQEIAVKKLSGSSLTTERELHKEVQIISKLRHKNLIHLLGFCSKQNQHCLVYEFMPNSSLDRIIFDQHRANSYLTWPICRNIIEGIARGLRYLHEECGVWIVHRDINPTNILLDGEMKPKIAGFGLARLMQHGENEGESTVIAGTIGYLDPEYYITGRVSVKSDVYSFGVCILTIISGRKAISHGEEPLIDYVTGCWNRGEAIDVIHQTLKEEEDWINEIIRYIQIGLLCVDHNSERRPTIDNVLYWLSGFSTHLPQPLHSDRSLEVAEVETDRSLSPSHSSVTSPMSSEHRD